MTLPSRSTSRTAPRRGAWIATGLALLACAGLTAQSASVTALLSESGAYATLPEPAFASLGWDLPDGGRTVKALADAAPGGAFDPAKLEGAKDLGYSARWHVVRYRRYGLDWDITGLHLTPDRPTPGLPTLVIVHGGSANLYEFFLDPANGPGLGQYLAQRLPVLLVTIPGNYTPGGWDEPVFDRRVPGYVLDRAISPAEARVRNAVFTFRLITDGLERLITAATRGPVLVIGHSTGGELQYLLKTSTIGPRLRARSLGWGTGGPALLTREFDEAEGSRAARVAQYGRYPRVDTLRARDAKGYVSSAYVGPLNPVPGATPLAVAEGWFAAEQRRRPQFKQVLQDMEHQGFVEHRPRLEREIREVLKDAPFGVQAEPVIADLFSTMTPPLDGYARMAWVVGRLDNGHWDAVPSAAREAHVAARFRQANPGAPIRVLAIDAPLTHYGHIERPRGLAAVLVDAARWVSE